MIRIAVCILHYGNPEQTSFLHQQFLSAEPAAQEQVFVLDNAAPLAYPQAWERLPENSLWTGGLAFALERMRAAGFSHLWFCNNDVELVSAPPYIARVSARLQQQEKSGRVGLLAPAMTHNPYHPHMISNGSQDCVSVHYADGVAPVLSITAVEEAGGLDCADNPRGYGVDIWLALRLKKLGWQVLVDHNLLIRHRHHSSAANIEGFLQAAAQEEDAYMQKRLGPGWREYLAQLHT